jgi:hypothetical protein
LIGNLDGIINLAHQLEKVEIFKDINVLLARLKALKAKVPDNKQPLEVRKAFSARIAQTWVKIFNFSPRLIDLSQEEVKALDNYSYVNYLIIQCKEAAVRVSPKTWEEIEERMLLVPNN